jgi:hypothetical protein
MEVPLVSSSKKKSVLAMIVREKIVMVGIKAPVHIIFLFNAYG